MKMRATVETTVLAKTTVEFESASANTGDPRFWSDLESAVATVKEWDEMASPSGSDFSLVAAEEIP